MPNIKNLPKDYDEYVKLAKVSKKNSAISQLNKFSFRYRLAEDFEGIIAPNVGRTLAGYNVITKLFLAYTAYEAIIKAARILRVPSVQSHELNTRFEPELAKKIRNNDKLKSYLISYALRNIFAHGELTASVIGTDTVAKRKDFTDLSNSMLDYCDDIFSQCLRRL
jgi:hypothetical protein